MLYDNFTSEKYEEIADLMEQAIQASNVESANKIIRILETVASSLPAPACNIAGELISATKAASGRKRNWEGHACHARSRLHLLKDYVIK